MSFGIVQDNNLSDYEISESEINQYLTQGDAKEITDEFIRAKAFLINNSTTIRCCKSAAEE